MDSTKALEPKDKELAMGAEPRLRHSIPLASLEYQDGYSHWTSACKGTFHASLLGMDSLESRICKERQKDDQHGPNQERLDLILMLVLGVRDDEECLMGWDGM
jgi:hypothetical protein